MNTRERIERLNLVLGVLKKMDLTPVDLITYASALDVIQRAQEEGEVPQRLAYRLCYSQCVIDEIEAILRTNGGLT